MTEDELAALERAAKTLIETANRHEARGLAVEPFRKDAALIRAMIERERGGGERAAVVAWLRGRGSCIPNTHTDCAAKYALAIEAGAHMGEKG